MSRRDEYGIDKLRRAEARRQVILDYLLANPWVGFEQLTAAMQALENPPEGLNPMTLRSAISAMSQKREIASSGSPRNRTYMALVTKTESAESMRQHHLDRQKRNNMKHADRYSEVYRKRKAEKNAALGKDDERAAHDKTVYDVYVAGKLQHRSGCNPSITKNQRGQGAL